MSLLFTNIKQLIQIRSEAEQWVAGQDMHQLPLIEEAFLLVQSGRIKAFGPMAECPKPMADWEIMDATGRLLLPAWVDSHTHLVYAGHREQEFVDRIKGLSYQEIANRGGGILNSARQLQASTEAELYEQSRQRLEQVMRMGTGAIEIKSGYGLTVEAELKMLRVIRRLKENYPIPIKATFLGAHALPAEYKNNKQAYLKLLIQELLPLIAAEQLADYIDIFCEEGYFSVADTEQLLSAGQAYGLRPKIHVNQFNAIGGVAAGVKYRALSVDHLEVLRKQDITALSDSSTMPVALPACSFFLGIPYTPATALIEAGLPLALASDYNPGSSPTGNMNFILATACIKMKLSPEAAINAATLNGAYAMGLEKEVGSITVGKRANLLLSKPLPSYAYWPYAFADHHIERVFIDGHAMS
ncbi:MAG TPA: imidazolonepropionase [Saprospiraceae bacterium]|nr:imidazolonepropionase [Saprospiraceae bacterium]